MITPEQAAKVVEVVDAGLCRGMGVPTPGEMCVEAAVCFALGMEHSDKPECVGPAVRTFKIALNDAAWPDNKARSIGLREIAVCQLGSNEIDQVEFAKYVSLHTIKRILPIALRNIGLNKEAEACENAADLSAAESAAWSAESAAWSAARSAAWSAAESAARSAAESAAESAARSAAESAESAAWSAARSAAWSAARSAAWSAAWSAAESAAKTTILTLAAKIGVEALRHCACRGVELWDQLNQQ